MVTKSQNVNYSNFIFWYWESNSGPWTCQAGAVPLSYIPLALF